MSDKTTGRHRPTIASGLMTARHAVARSTVAVAILAVACVRAHKVSVDTRIPAKLEISPFARILVAGFIGTGTTEVDLSVETVRLLRTELRSQTSLEVIEAAVLPLAEIAASSASDIGRANLVTNRLQNAECSRSLKGQTFLDACRHVFANAVFWKGIGEEYQSPLIVTGTLLFTPRRRGGALAASIIFIDGRTGSVIHSAGFQERVSDAGKRYVPTLSSYFRLMDRVTPAFLGLVSEQNVRGTRTLLH